MSLRRSTMLLALLVTVIGVGAWALPYVGDLYRGELPFDEVCDVDPAQVTVMVICHGTIGEAVSTHDSEHIADIFAVMAQRGWLRDRTKRQTVGWSYYIDLSMADGDTTRMTFKGDRAEVDWISSDGGWDVKRSRAYRLSPGVAPTIQAQLAAMFAELSQP